MYDVCNQACEHWEYYSVCSVLYGSALTPNTACTTVLLYCTTVVQPVVTCLIADIIHSDSEY